MRYMFVPSFVKHTQQTMKLRRPGMYSSNTLKHGTGIIEAVQERPLHMLFQVVLVCSVYSELISRFQVPIRSPQRKQHKVLLD